jgi:methionyl aminopeptidase
VLSRFQALTVATDRRTSYQSSEGKKKKKKKKSMLRSHCFIGSRLTLGFSGKKKKVVQSTPPRVAVSKIFKNGVYPVGEEQEYKNE